MKCAFGVAFRIFHTQLFAFAIAGTPCQRGFRKPLVNFLLALCIPLFPALFIIARNVRGVFRARLFGALNCVTAAVRPLWNVHVDLPVHVERGAAAVAMFFPRHRHRPATRQFPGWHPPRQPRNTPWPSMMVQNGVRFRNRVSYLFALPKDLSRHVQKTLDCAGTASCGGRRHADQRGRDCESVISVRCDRNGNRSGISPRSAQRSRSAARWRRVPRRSACATAAGFHKTNDIPCRLLEGHAPSWPCRPASVCGCNARAAR